MPGYIQSASVKLSRSYETIDAKIKIVHYQHAGKFNAHSLYMTTHFIVYISNKLQSKLYACHCLNTNLLFFGKAVYYKALL